MKAQMQERVTDPVCIIPSDVVDAGGAPLAKNSLDIYPHVAIITYRPRVPSMTELFAPRSSDFLC
jgi:hypothetical protein